VNNLSNSICMINLSLLNIPIMH